jgi:hypothetical protein
MVGFSKIFPSFHDGSLAEMNCTGDGYLTADNMGNGYSARITSWRLNSEANDLWLESKG